MINVYVYPADAFGCGHYRMIWPAMALHESDLNITIIPPGHPTGLSALTDGRGRPRQVIPPRDADVIVLQRPTLSTLAQSVPLYRAKGIAVVVDMDDDLKTIHPSNPAWLMMHPKNSSPHSWLHVTQACRDATLVTVSSERLIGRYCGEFGSRFLPNYVPKAMLDTEHLDSVTIGWAGSLHSHPNDLDVLGPSIRRLTDVGAKFMIVGNGFESARCLNMQHDPPYTGAIDFDKWPSAVTQIGVGVAPLADTQFNASKSWLKPLEYSACGVPWIASPRAEYTRLHNLGVGLLAERSKDWERCIAQLMTNDSTRLEQSEAGRRIAQTLTIEQHAWRWAEVWSEACQLQRSMRRTTMTDTISTSPASA